MKVAETILKQLGGGRFAVMTGAKGFVDGGDHLSFIIPTAKQKITRVRIFLEADDTYRVEFGKVLKLHYKVVETKSDIYADKLREVFTRATGLDCTL